MSGSDDEIEHAPPTTLPLGSVYHPGLRPGTVVYAQPPEDINMPNQYRHRLHMSESDEDNRLPMRQNSRTGKFWILIFTSHHHPHSYQQVMKFVMPYWNYYIHYYLKITFLHVTLRIFCPFHVVISPLTELSTFLGKNAMGVSPFSILPLWEIIMWLSPLSQSYLPFWQNQITLSLMPPVIVSELWAFSDGLVVNGA